MKLMSLIKSALMVGAFVLFFCESPPASAAGICSCRVHSQVFNCDFSTPMDNRDDCNNKTRGHGSFIPTGSAQTSSAAPTTCDLVDGLQIYKTGSGTSQDWSVFLNGESKYKIKDLNGLFGGKNPPKDCAEIYRNGDMAIVKVGWKQDLLIAFGITKKNDVPTEMSVIYFLPHEKQMHIIGASDNNFVAQYGKKNDLYLRACFKPDEKVKWWHNHWHRDGPGPCVDSNWPTFYPTSSIEDVKF